jgi:hypothetical protein
MVFQTLDQNPRDFLGSMNPKRIGFAAMVGGEQYPKFWTGKYVNYAANWCAVE